MPGPGGASIRSLFDSARRRHFRNPFKPQARYCIASCSRVRAAVVRRSGGYQTCDALRVRCHIVLYCAMYASFHAMSQRHFLLPGCVHLRVTWEVYGGNIFDEHPPADSRDRRAYGGRVTYQTPFDGLSFLLSGYRTQVELLATGELINEDRYIVSVDYVHAAWDVKSEFGTRKFRGVDTDAYYVQVGRTLDKWMPFVRFDSVVTDTALSSSDSYSQRILVAGVNYSLRNNISLRIENHFNHGYALPVASGEVPVNGGIRSWNLLVAGLHFIL